MPGNRLNPVSFSGIRSSAKVYPIVMQIKDTVRFLPILCGEIPLCPYDSCRLLAINLYSYVQNPFTKGAFFDFPLFKKHVAIAQRIMDDIIDLELEKIDAILDKVHEDPESEEVKGVEIRLWEKIKQKAKEKAGGPEWVLRPREICWLLWVCVMEVKKRSILLWIFRRL